jgi:hypothetical protein
MDRREHTRRKQRIGRKAIATVRVAITIDRKLDTSTPTKKKFHINYSFRKWHAYVAAGVVVVAVGAIFAINTINAQIAKQKAAEDARLQKIEEEKAIQRDECRGEILAQ